MINKASLLAMIVSVLARSEKRGGAPVSVPQAQVSLTKHEAVFTVFCDRGSVQAGDCWCDEDCELFGNCCADACERCGFGCDDDSGDAGCGVRAPSESATDYSMNLRMDEAGIHVELALPKTPARGAAVPATCFDRPAPRQVRISPLYHALHRRKL